MPPVKVKGSPYRVTAKKRVYWYAWRNGPRLLSQPGSPAFLQELADALASRHAPDKSRMSGLIAQYRASPDFLDLAQSTRDLWHPHLDRIREHFGTLSIRQFDRPAIKPEIRRWHHAKKGTPRAADTGLQALSRVLSFGRAEGKLGTNQCEGMAYLHKSNRADLIWTDDQIAVLLTHSSPEMAWAARLAVLTGLRRGDLLSLGWSHVEANAIELRTGKSRGRRTATIPLTGELRALLRDIPRRSTVILTSSDKKPWTGDGFGSSWWKTLQRAGLSASGLHFHDFRGTAATKMFLAGLTNREIAQVLGWSEDRVDRLLDRYVKRDEIMKGLVTRLEAAERVRKD